MARGAKGVVDAWSTSILTALDDEQSKDNPLDHKLVKFLMAEFVEALAELEARKAELDSRIKSATPDKGAARTVTRLATTSQRWTRRNSRSGRSSLPR